jgi:hypothetical protein
MPFSVRPYLRFPAQCAVTNNSGTCIKRPRSTAFDPKQKYTTDRYQRGSYADPHKNP